MSYNRNTGRRLIDNLQNNKYMSYNRNTGRKPGSSLTDNLQNNIYVL